jgi:hypothetical protein
MSRIFTYRLTSPPRCDGEDRSRTAPTVSPGDTEEFNMNVVS